MKYQYQEDYLIKKYIQHLPSIFEQLKEKNREIHQIEFALEEAKKKRKKIKKKIELRIKRLWHKLSPRERRVIQLRLGLDGYEQHTLEQAGKYFDVTRERIRCLENMALLKLGIKLVQKTFKK